MKFVLLTVLASLFIHINLCHGSASDELGKIFSVALVQAKNVLLIESGHAKQQLEAFVDESLQKTSGMSAATEEVRQICSDIARDTKVMDDQIVATEKRIINTLVNVYQKTLDEVVSYLQK